MIESCVSVVFDKRRRQVSLAGSVNKMGCIAVVIKRGHAFRAFAD